MKKRFFSIIMLICISFFSTSCSSTNSEDDKKVRIAFFPNITHAQALLGMSNGSFEEALGSDYIIEWRQFIAGPSEIEAMFAGEIDLGYIGPGPAINAYVKSHGDLKIIAGVADAGAILVSRKDSRITNIMDLDGKKVAVPQFGNTQDICLRNLLDTSGLKDITKGGTVEICQVQNSDVKTLFDHGELDAALVPEPWGSLLVKDTGANIVLDYDEIWMAGKYPTAVIIARKEFILEHPDFVEKFLKIHYELSDYIIKNTAIAANTINNQIEVLTKKAISEDILTASFDRLIITTDPEKDAIEGFIKLSTKLGYIDTEVNIEELVNLSVLNKVLTDKGIEPIK